MSSNLPNRWQEILRHEAAENVGTVLAQAKDQPGPKRIPRWALPVGVVLAASMSVLGLIDANDTQGRSSVPFDRATVLSTRTAGLGASAEDLAPPTPAPPPDLSKLEASPRSEERAHEHRDPFTAVKKTQAPACPECEKRKAHMLAAEAAAAPSPATNAMARPAPSPTPKPGAPTINVGTRFKAVLTDPVVTGVALAPATAKVAEDVAVGDRVALPAGTVLVGEAFATQEGDRAQVVFSALVKDGKTHPLEGWALQDGEMGLKGRVIKKGSKGKKGAARLLGAAATGLSVGLAGALPGAEGAALSTLGTSVAADIEGLGREWRISDKVVRVEAGAAVTIYLRRDLKVE